MVQTRRQERAMQRQQQERERRRERRRRERERQAGGGVEMAAGRTRRVEVAAGVRASQPRGASLR